MENSSNSEDNPNPENNEDSNSDSDKGSAMDVNDPEYHNVEEIKDPEHNAPERIMGDLDKAKNNDPDTLEEVLKDLEKYLEEEFIPEYKRSESEADDL